MLVISGKNERQCLVEIFDNEQRLVYQRMINVLDPTQIEWLATTANWKTSDVYAKTSELIHLRTSETFEFTVDEEIKPPFTVSIREIFGTAKEYFPAETPFEAFALAFDFAKLNSYKEPVLAWTDDGLACLDIDYHDITPPTLSERESLVARLKPAPVAWHHSHGGGLKLFYESTDDLSANELASIAQYFFSRLDSRATFDRIKETRHPAFPRSRDNAPACSPTITRTYSFIDVSALKGMLMGEPSEEDVSSYLSSKQWTIGQSLPHTLCPIDPSDNDRTSVFVGEKGIFCHRCKARGLRNGFMSYALMIDSTPPILASILVNLVHYDHASIILSRLFHTSDSVTKDIYAAMLKLMHGPDDSRIYQVFSNGIGFVRIRGQWVTKDGSTTLTQNLPKFAQSLPAAKVKSKDGPVVDVSKATALMNAGDISHLGYHPITFIRGCRIFSQHCTIDDNFHVITRPEFRQFPPRYLIVSKRMDEEAAWGLLEDIFPKIDRGYVELLIAAKGSSEGRTSQCPYILVSGPSGAGKSTIVHIAASICGDKAEEPLWVPDTVRFRQSLMDAARNADFLCINEIFKESIRAKLTPIQALNPLLSLTEDSRSHAMYVGSVPFGRLPVIVLTDIDVPPEVETDIQLSRRLILHRLNSRTYWDRSLAERQIRPGLIRTINSTYALACDTILSSVIDKYFQYPRPLADIAKDIGITTGNENEKVDCIKQSLLNLFNKVRDAPELTDSHKQRYPGIGWKLIDKNVDNDILQAWNDLADNGGVWGGSRSVQSTDWQELLNAPMPIKCQVNAFRQRFIYIRFRDTTNKLIPIWVNDNVGSS